MKKYKLIDINTNLELVIEINDRSFEKYLNDYYDETYGNARLEYNSHDKCYKLVFKSDQYVSSKRTDCRLIMSSYGEIHDTYYFPVCKIDKNINRSQNSRNEERKYNNLQHTILYTYIGVNILLILTAII